MKKDDVLEFIKKNFPEDVTATQLSNELKIDRSNISRYLNEFYKEGLLQKIDGRPVKYSYIVHQDRVKSISFDTLIGNKGSLLAQIKKAKAAMLYPPRGLHTIIFGETGTGKTMFAECMYQFAVSEGIFTKEAPFITFNCADYAQNPQLLFAHIFGVKKGAFTGAEETREGLVAQADGGILFLDEIHRLPPEGQEMLFTFIDKGVYRPLGSNEEAQASVQIIGATTENSATFLATFNRRIPMQIEMPTLDERGLDERMAIIQSFLQQETNRLNHGIEIDQKSLLAFMLYQPEGNIGQLKRDLKMVCAKAFLHYHTSESTHFLDISEDLLSVAVQKGLLRLNEMIEKISPLIDNKNVLLQFKPGKTEVIWAQDPQSDMGVYTSISYKLDKLENAELGSVIDLDTIISKDVDRYFETYVDELYQPIVYQELITEELWQMVNKLYDDAESKLKRAFDEKVRFAFALHITSMIERLHRHEKVAHPDLNDIRRKHRAEFHEALDWSMKIEDQFDVIVPIDEIGFIAMFLTNEISENKEVENRQVEVVVIMHGNSTASSMLETCQELLGVEHGIAFNMPLTMKTEELYQQFYSYIASLKDRFSEGILLLTDMGSPGNFGQLLEKELGVTTRVITMASTMVVLESLRLASMGRTLEDIQETVQQHFLNIVKPYPQDTGVAKEKVIIVACFTGEGVAQKLKKIISTIIDTETRTVLEMQFLEKESFKSRINTILETKDIVAIIGTVEIKHKGIPFIPAIDVFNTGKIIGIQELLNNKLSINELATDLGAVFGSEKNASLVFEKTEKYLSKIKAKIGVVVQLSVYQGILLHIGFLVRDKKEGNNKEVDFPNMKAYIKEHESQFLLVSQEMNGLGDKLHIKFTEKEKAYIVYLFNQNAIDVYQN